MLAHAFAPPPAISKRSSRFGMRACVADPCLLIRDLAAGHLRTLGSVEVIACATPAQTRRVLRSAVPDLLIIDAAWLKSDIRLIAQANSSAIVPICMEGRAGLKKPFLAASLHAEVRAVLGWR